MLCTTHFNYVKMTKTSSHFLQLFRLDAFSAGCGNRFTHANRHCPKHPFSRLKREEPKEGLGKAQSVDNKAVAEWLAK